MKSPRDKARLRDYARSHGLRNDIRVLSVLKTEGVTTGKQIAEKTGLDLRTVYRVIARCRAAGAPIRSDTSGYMWKGD